MDGACTRCETAGMAASRVLLIGGPSHAGKTTLAEGVAARLGWAHVSTDWMARHPGRPWTVEERPVPEQVAHHYKSLSVDELVADVMRHYNGMWPDIEGLARTHVIDESADRLVLEGSAVLPERVAAAGLEQVAACWLTADAGLLETRIHVSSDYARSSPAEQELIQKFVRRNDGLNALMMDAVKKHGLHSVDTGRASGVDALSAHLLDLVET